MSKKCKAYSESKLGLEPPDNRKAFYAGWDAALRAALAEQDRIHSCGYYCTQPACIKAQRDELRDKLFNQKGNQNEDVQGYGV